MAKRTAPSSAHDRRRQKRLERELRTSRCEIDRQAKAWRKKTFFRRPDAEAAAAKAQAWNSAYHRLDVCIDKRPRYALGRPKKNVPRAPIAIDYALRTDSVEKREAID